MAHWVTHNIFAHQKQEVWVNTQYLMLALILQCFWSDSDQCPSNFPASLQTFCILAESELSYHLKPWLSHPLYRVETMDVLCTNTQAVLSTAFLCVWLWMHPPLLYATRHLVWYSTSQWCNLADVTSATSGSVLIFSVIVCRLQRPM